jgi:hypothetical protein
MELQETEMQDIQIKDAYITRELEANGYVVVPGLAPAMVSEFRHTTYKEVKKLNNNKLNYNTGADLTGPIRCRTFEKIKEAFTPVLGKYFGNHEIILGIMFVKKPSAHSKGQVGLHFDPTLLPDENKQKHINIWSPLIDVNETNGALCLIPRSHKIFAPVHAITIRPPFSKIADTVLKYGKCIRMKAGEFLIFDNRIIHYSFQNFSKADRPSIVLSLVPLESDFISLFKSKDQKSPIEVFQQPRSWYRDTVWINGMERPKTGNFIGYLKYEPYSFSKEEFIERMESCRSGIDYSFELKG